MIRRLSIPFRQREQTRHARPVRILAVSDEEVRSFDFESNRAALKPVDAIVACGDLDASYLCFLGDAFRVPLLYVAGNHDRGANWEASRPALPRRLDGRVERIGDLLVAGLSWPGPRKGRAARDDLAAWGQALRLAVRSVLRGRPSILLSHVPPLGLGDTPEDQYHRGFAAYRWLCRFISPVVWLHGHTAMAAASSWHVKANGTTLVNVTGAVLVELGVAADGSADSSVGDQVAA